MPSTPGLCTWCFLSLQSRLHVPASLPPILSQVLPEASLSLYIKQHIHVHKHTHTLHFLSPYNPFNSFQSIYFHQTCSIYGEICHLSLHLSLMRTRTLFCPVWSSQHLHGTCRHLLKICSKKVLSTCYASGTVQKTLTYIICLDPYSKHLR